MSYLDGSQGNSGKGTTREKLERLRAGGILYGLVFETDGRAGTTFASGWDDGEKALSDLAYLDNLVPQRTTVFNGQFDFDAAVPDAYTEYVNGWHAALITDARMFRDGVYGGERLVAWAMAHWPAITAWWQTLAWSWTRPLAGVSLFQYETGSSYADRTGQPLQLCGINVDLDRCFDPSVLIGGEDDMNDEQLVAALKRIWAGPDRPEEWTKADVREMVKQDPETRATIAEIARGVPPTTTGTGGAIRTPVPPTSPTPTEPREPREPRDT